MSNRDEKIKTAICEGIDLVWDASVTVAIAKLIRRDHPDGLTATATELLTLLNATDLVSDGVRKQRNWPQTPQGLGNRIDRIAPLLKAQGFAIERRHSGVRNIIIVPPAPSSEPPAVD